MISIDGIVYNVPVISLRRKGQFLDKYAERTEDGELHRELIGVYFNYELNLGRSINIPDYAALWDKLTEPVEFHTVIVPDGTEGEEFEFTAYFSNVADELIKTEAAKNFWKNLTVNFIAKSPARVP